MKSVEFLTNNRGSKGSAVCMRSQGEDQPLKPGDTVSIEGSTNLEDIIYRGDGYIKSIKLEKSSSLFYDYVITVTMKSPSSGGFDFNFVDQTGDSYSLYLYTNTFTENHIVRYNSKKPNIQQFYWKPS